jgi:hypothetical protein
VIFSSTSIQATFENSTFTQSSALDGGVAFIDLNSTIIIFNSSFQLNQASNFGGVIFSPDSKLNISNSIFANNAAVCGGAIYVFDSRNFILNQSTFIQNRAIMRELFTCAVVTGAGGAIFSQALKQFMISNSSFI